MIRGTVRPKTFNGMTPIAPKTRAADQAVKDPRHHRFVPGVGYIFAGPPPVQVLVPRAIAKGACEPPDGAPDWSWHYLNAPAAYGGTVKLQWRPATRDWHPVLGRGNRLAFSADYLASHGWTYNRPA